MKMNLENQLQNNKQEKMQENKELNENYENEISRYLESIPKEDDSEMNLREEEEARIDLLKKRGLSSQEIAEIVKKDTDLIKLSYQDRRPCFKEAIFNRKYIEAELFKKIQKINQNDPEARDRVAMISLDLNGLKALNDIGGHSAGDRGLGIMAEILQGKKPDPNNERKLIENQEGTVSWLKTLGINSIPFTQGGDEFGILIYSDSTNIKEIEKEIKSRFVKEIVTNEEARKILKFDKEKTEELKKDKGVDVSENFEFKLGASIGISTLSDAEDDSWIKEGTKESSLKIKEGDNDFSKIRKMRTRMIVHSDQLAMRNKEEVKEKQVKENGVIVLENGEELVVGKELYSLYNIRSKDEIAKQREFNEMKEKFDCLKNKASNEDLEECKAS